MMRILAALAFTIISHGAGAVTLAEISNQDAVTGLREALVQGSGRAVGLLGKTDGFLGNPQVRIPLPQSLQRIEGTMRMFGLGHQADELVTTMNRAAESAVPEARTLLVDSIKKMSISDAKGILAGPPDGATQYFKRTTSSALAARFLPIVQQATAKVQLTEMYNNYAGKAASFGLLNAEDANLDQYITQRALDGLFTMIAEEEKSIRANPMGSAVNIVKRVFGAIGK
ncbi:MAG: DUF4197 domain-containing protein [Burkholderiales bacterium]